jgi:hypothetical protein
MNKDDIKNVSKLPRLREENCDCGKKAKYLVYKSEDPHCEACMLDAADNSNFIEVRAIN